MSSAIRAPASWAIVAISSTGCQAPVEVSAWTIPTTLGRSRLDGGLDLSGSNTSPYGRSIDRDLGPGALGDVFHPGAEHAVDADEHLVAGLDQVDDDGFHPGRARPGNRQRQPILGLKHVAEQVLGLVHQRHELGVEVAEQRRCACASRTRGWNVAGPGPRSTRFERLQRRGDATAGTSAGMARISRELSKTDARRC